jgi:hypothetical protein
MKQYNKITKEHKQVDGNDNLLVAKIRPLIPALQTME